MNKKIYRRIYSHNHHLAAAEYFLATSKEKGKNEVINATACLIFAAFTIEAYLNHIGEKLFPSWKEYLKKGLNSEAKLCLIADKIGLTINFGTAPFQSFRTAFRFRNAMAHSVTEDLSSEKSKHFLQVGSEYWPATEWEKLCNSNIAQKLYNDTEEIILIIEKKSGVERIPFFLLSEFVET